MAGMSPQVEASWNRSFDQMQEYLKALVRDLKTDEGIVTSDAANLARIDQTVRTIEAQAQELGFNESLQGSIADYLKIRKGVLTEATDLGLPSVFSTESNQAIRMLLEGAEKEMLQHVSSHTDLLGDVLRRSLTGVMQVDDIIQSLEDAGKTRYRALTEINTSMHSFNSQLGVMHAKEAGVTEFAYVGPLDNITRLWCSHWVNRRDTMENFEATAGNWKRSAPPGPVAVFRGGWNCRHRFVPALTPRFKKFPKGHK
jgi:hypothetical protein